MWIFLVYLFLSWKLRGHDIWGPKRNWHESKTGSWTQASSTTPTMQGKIYLITMQGKIYDHHLNTLWQVFLIAFHVKSFLNHNRSSMNTPYHCGFFLKLWDQLLGGLYPTEVLLNLCLNLYLTEVPVKFPKNISGEGLLLRRVCQVLIFMQPTTFLIIVKYSI